ncbi:hypothetical protein IFM89_038157 [Coptis chinensis]|uniref:Uncharacterized protein n=1 Tax=Coptis chinensis TaxID=261450 RepID=A0A835HZL0_9MAGN|nr:hypothetical protein IFM89_038157 [Coptis chinensis]
MSVTNSSLPFKCRYEFVNKGVKLMDIRPHLSLQMLKKLLISWIKLNSSSTSRKQLTDRCLYTIAVRFLINLFAGRTGNLHVASVFGGKDSVQVTSYAWLNDLCSQIEHTRILSTVYCSASALGSRLPSFASAREKVAGAEGILRPVSKGVASDALIKKGHSITFVRTIMQCTVSCFVGISLKKGAIIAFTTAAHEGLLSEHQQFSFLSSPHIHAEEFLKKKIISDDRWSSSDE